MDARDSFVQGDQVSVDELLRSVESDLDRFL